MSSTNGAIEWHQEGLVRASGVSKDAQTLADRDQTLADTDQTGSDSDQTAADSDQAASDSDQAASDSDQAASDNELVHGGDASAHDYARDQRDRGAQQRQRGTSVRVEAAGARDAVANARDLAAVERDQAAEIRDRELAARDVASADYWRASRSAAGGGRADSNRRSAAADRAAAAEGRARAAADREQAARDRQQAARDRAQAQADREALLHQLAVAGTDQLTGSRTRATGLDDLEHEIDRARRTGNLLVVVYVDVVGLKAVNDRFGHAAGDALLQRAVGGIRSHLRSYDLIVRLGGDEFLCVMSGVTLQHARDRFATVETALAAYRDRCEIKVGFAALQSGDSAAQLISRADAELPISTRH